MARVLIACEYSGVVRRAFTAAGHETWSCDLLPAEDGSNHHLRGDVRDYLHMGWDLLAVMHPPCTRLCRSGRRWLSGPGIMTPPKSLPRGRTWESMIEEFDKAVELIEACWLAPIDRVAIENPRMHDLARMRMPTGFPRPHIVQPFWFGHPEYKETGLHLRALPELAPTNRLPEPIRGTDEWRSWHRVHRMAPGDNRGHERSRFFPGIAEAMASQWGAVLDADPFIQGDLFEDIA